MSERLTYELSDGIATITMDDGKANALSTEMLAELHASFEHAASDRATVVLSGRDGRFSGGFDLRTLTGGGSAGADLLRSGFELSVRMLSFPFPVVIACTGHAIAMGAFLLLSADERVGAYGAFKIQANEVAMGFTMPFAAIEVCRQRLATSHFDRVVNNAETYAPDDAVAAGFLDRVVDPADVGRVARERAAALAQINLDAHAATKLRTREAALAAIRAAIAVDDAAFRSMLGLSG